MEAFIIQWYCFCPSATILMAFSCMHLVSKDERQLHELLRRACICPTITDMEVSPATSFQSSILFSCMPTDQVRSWNMREPHDVASLFFFPCISMLGILMRGTRNSECWTYFVHSLEAAPTLRGWHCYPKQSNGNYACLWWVGENI